MVILSKLLATDGPLLMDSRLSVVFTLPSVKRAKLMGHPDTLFLLITGDIGLLVN